MQQMFSFPVACVVFAILGLPLGLHTRKEGRLAGSPSAIGVVLVYYALMELSEGWVKSCRSAQGHPWQTLPAELGPLGPQHRSWSRSACAAVVAKPLGEGRVLAFPCRDSSRRVKPADARCSAIGRQAGARDRASRAPNSACPGPGCSTATSRRYYLRIAVLALPGSHVVLHRHVVDLSEKVFKGQAGLSMLVALLWYRRRSSSRSSFRSRCCWRPRDHRRAHPIRRAHGDARVGVSLYRVALPLILFACAAAGCFSCSRTVSLGESSERPQTLKDRIRGRAAAHCQHRQPNWLVGRRRPHLSLQAFEAPTASNGNRPDAAWLSVYRNRRPRTG